LTKNLGRILVVGVSNIRDGDKQLERVLLIGFSDTTLDISLDLGFALLSVSITSGLTPHNEQDFWRLRSKA
jgi:hypothetical protein